MLRSRWLLRSIRPPTEAPARLYTNGRVGTRVASPYLLRRQQHFFRSLGMVTTLGVIASAWQWYAGEQLLREIHAESPPDDAALQFEQPREKGETVEETRDLISSPHLQAKRSWENPGVYAWGSNAGKVAAPDSTEPIIKTPRRIPFFDGVLLRDLKLDKTFAAAIDENGDLYQWGSSYSEDATKPTRTLKGRNLTSLVLSRDRVICLGSDGSVYSIPVSKQDQQTGSKQPESGRIPFWSSTSDISYRKLQPEGLGFGEKISSIAGGLEHILLLTNKGRVFSAASSSQEFPTKGQLGIPGLTWETRPEGAYDRCHEVTTLKGFSIAQVAAGDYHSVVADKAGRIFTFGDNAFGQLGFEYSSRSPIIDAPTHLPIEKLYSGTSQVPRVTSVAAGGLNSYLTVDAITIPPLDVNSNPLSTPDKITAETWSFGRGIWGTLGNGRWTHRQERPTKVQALSGLFEYNEKASKTVPIRIAQLSVGQTHAAVVLDNITHVSTSSSSETDVNWGADILFFGSNESYQLGTGKRSNVANPTYIQPLETETEKSIRGGEEERFQITPKNKVKVNGRWKNIEQKVECGRGVTAVYSSTS